MKRCEIVRAKQEKKSVQLKFFQRKRYGRGERAIIKSFYRSLLVLEKKRSLKAFHGKKFFVLFYRYRSQIP